MSRRPDNYYSMSSQERQAWDNQERAREDLEYERDEEQRRRQRAERAAEESSRHARALSSDYNDACEQLSEVTAQRDGLLVACKRVLRAIEWSVTEDRLSNEEMAGTLRDAIEKGGA